jgi:hypothetical protein
MVALSVPIISVYIVMLAIMRVATDIFDAANDRKHLLTDSPDERDHRKCRPVDIT